MLPARATPADTVAIYSLLHDANFQGLPPYSLAKGILEDTEALVVKADGRAVIWAAYHGTDEIFLDLVIAPNLPRHKITKGVSKYILAHGLNLSHNGRIAIEAYNPKGVKAALVVGFKIDGKPDREGWTRLVLTREVFERKFSMRGKSV